MPFAGAKHVDEMYLDFLRLYDLAKKLSLTCESLAALDPGILADGIMKAQSHVFDAHLVRYGISSPEDLDAKGYCSQRITEALRILRLLNTAAYDAIATVLINTLNGDPFRRP